MTEERIPGMDRVEERIRRLENVIRIVDDDAFIRESFCYLLEGEGWRTRAYPSAEAFLEEDDPAVPGCLVLDVRMPGGMSGLELQQELLRCSCGLPVIFVSAHGDIEMAVRAVLNGACDFMPKPIDEEKLLASIDRAVDRCAEIYRRRADLKNSEDRWNQLTAREKEVARLLARGLPNKQIAAELGITNRTAQVHRANIYVKLGVRSAAEITSLIDTIRSHREG